MRTFVLLFLGLVFVTRLYSSENITNRDVKTVLEELDKCLEKRSEYLDHRIRRIDTVRYKLSIPRLPLKSQLALTWELAELYDGYLSDSALIYYTKGMDMAAGNDNLWFNRFRIKRCVTLPLVALFNEAVQEFDAIEIDSLPAEDQILAFDAGRQLFSYVASFYVDHTEHYRTWINRSMEMQEWLIRHLEPNSQICKFNEAEYLFMIGEYQKSRIMLMELLDKLPSDSNLTARVANKLSRIAAYNNNENEEVYFLARSAIADTKSATLEVVSLQDLGQLLYRHGDLNRAYSYLSVALDNSVQCHAVMRMLQTSQALPVIQNAHIYAINKSQTRLHVAIAIMAILILISLIILALLRIELTKTKRLENHLRGANKLKEMYMAQFLNLATVYMDKLNKFCKIASRKISTGHVDELYRITRSGKFVEEQTQDFYNTFDKAFLHIYPSFPNDVNSLLRSDEQIVLRDGELLNTDLRILAFIRLGVEDSPRIAQALNYSVHTIYSYRNRLRNRAINRDTFEQDVAAIGC